ncbi:MAG: molybdopterin-dependent oxidoreductase, partial [Mycobacterium sp.]|nr:molybdopterin-dependent oxidoreductase [Mycobacterium sp.]
MSGYKPPEKDFSDEELKVGPPKKVAAGLPSIAHSMIPALRNFGPRKTFRASFTMNHKRGFDCPSCAWISENKPPAIDFCENGMKSLNSEITPVLIPRDFWAANSLTSMLDKSEFWLGRQGRITEPVYRAKGSDHYEVIEWDRALDLISDRLRSLDSPDDAVFYTSGRIMNEPAFLYQLFAREYGTNNLPDC